MNLCIDIGGMSTKFAIIDDKKIIDNFVVKNENLIDYLTLKNILITETSKILKKHSIKNICISSPGVINSQTGEIGGISAIKNLHKINIKETLEKEFSTKTFIENDANCAALAELHYGAAKDLENVIFLVIGTGIGGGIVINKKIYKGSFNKAGEFGCASFIRKENDYINVSEDLGMAIFEAKALKKYEKKLTGFEIYQEYEKNNSYFELVTEHIEGIARLICDLSFSFDPQAFIIGGGISQNDYFIKLLRDAAEKRIKKSSITYDFKIIPCEFREKANLFGANSLAKF